MGAHNKRAVTMVVAPGMGGQRERKEEESLSREAASKVARQAGQQFCLCERFAPQKTKLLSVFELHNLRGFQE